MSTSNLQSPIPVNNTQQWGLAPTLNGSVWDLTGAMVTLNIRTPGGTITPYACVVSGSPGTALSAAVVFTTALFGTYTWSWMILQGNAEYVTQPVGFIVEGSP